MAVIGPKPHPAQTPRFWLSYRLSRHGSGTPNFARRAHLRLNRDTQQKGSIVLPTGPVRCLLGLGRTARARLSSASSLRSSSLDGSASPELMCTLSLCLRASSSTCCPSDSCGTWLIVANSVMSISVFSLTCMPPRIAGPAWPWRRQAPHRTFELSVWLDIGDDARRDVVVGRGCDNFELVPD